MLGALVLGAGCAGGCWMAIASQRPAALHHGSADNTDMGLVTATSTAGPVRCRSPRLRAVPLALASHIAWPSRSRFRVICRWSRPLASPFDDPARGQPLLWRVGWWFTAPRSVFAPGIVPPSQRQPSAAHRGPRAVHRRDRPPPSTVGSWRCWVADTWPRPPGDRNSHRTPDWNGWLRRSDGHRPRRRGAWWLESPARHLGRAALRRPVARFCGPRLRCWSPPTPINPIAGPNGVVHPPGRSTAAVSVTRRARGDARYLMANRRNEAAGRSSSIRASPSWPWVASESTTTCPPSTVCAS